MTTEILKDYIIYKIYCKNKEITDEYYGNTSAFRQRKNQHKNCCNNENSPSYNQEKYKIIRSNGGWDNWIMSPIEEIKNCSLVNATIREQYHIDLNKYNMNTRKSYIIEKKKLDYNKKYRIENRDKILEYHKEYHLENRDKILEKKKEKYLENRDKILEKKKEKYLENRDKILEKKKEKYLENRNKNKEKYLENRDKILEKQKEKMTCICGSTFRICDKAQHNKSKKHCDFIK